jgi:predicted RNA-binding protein YlxR (DUF448 family)
VLLERISKRNGLSIQRTVITHSSAALRVRTCLGCRGRDSQLAMVRLIALPGGVALWSRDSEGGRGGYLHPSASCLEGFERSRVKEFRSLKRRLGSDERRAITELVRKRLVSQAGVD